MLRSIEESLNLIGVEDDQQLVASLFRLFHNFKGMAGFMNLANLKTVATGSESILEHHRQKNLKLTSETKYILQLATDVIKNILGEKITDQAITSFSAEVKSYLQSPKRSLTDSPQTSELHEGSIEKILHDVRPELADFIAGSATHHELVKLKHSFGLVNDLAQKDENKLIAKTSQAIYDFFKIYLNESLAIHYSFVRRVQEIIDYLNGLLFIQKNQPAFFVAGRIRKKADQFF